MFNNLADKYQRAFYARKTWTIETFQSYFAPHQVKKLIYTTEQKLLQKGYKQEDLCYGKHQTAVMGVILENRKDKKIELPKDMKGVYVYDVFHKDAPWHATAYLFGIKQGDIILNIDGYEMDRPETLKQYIQSLKPYDWVTVHIKRGKKEMDVEVELTWY